MTGTFADVETVSWTFVFAVIAVAAAGHLAAILIRAWRSSGTRLDRDLEQLGDDINAQRLRAVEEYANRRDVA